MQIQNGLKVGIKEQQYITIKKKYKLSQADIDKVIELENRHFGALSGQGMVQIKLDNLEKALDSYRKVLEIYHSNKAAKTLVDEIEKTIKEETI